MREAAMLQVRVEAALQDPALRSESAPLLDWGRRRFARYLEPRGFGDPEAAMRQLRRAAEEGGRDIRTVSTTLFGAEPEAGYLERCRAAGVDRALIGLPSEGRDVILPLLDRYAVFLQ